MEGECTWQQGTHSRSTVEGFAGLGRSTDTPARVHLRHRPPRVLRLRGQRRDAGRVPPRRSRRLPHRRRRRGRPASRHPAPFGHRNPRGRHERARHPRRRPGRAQRLRLRSPPASRSTPTRRSENIEALLAQSQKRSAVFDVITNPTDVVVELSPRLLTGPSAADHAPVMIGAGHAGLAMSRRLSERSVEHTVLDRGDVAELMAEQAMAGAPASDTQLDARAARPTRRPTSIPTASSAARKWRS